MPSTSVARADQAKTPPAKARAPKVQGRTKLALDLMVWDDKTDAEAAVEAQISIHTIRLALKLPHYRAYYREQCEMLRSRENPRNIHTLIEIRDQQSNQMARVAAIKELERTSDQQVMAGSARSPGVVVIIQQGGSGPAPSAVIGAQLTQPPPLTIDNDEIST